MRIVGLYCQLIADGRTEGDFDDLNVAKEERARLCVKLVESHDLVETGARGEGVCALSVHKALKVKSVATKAIVVEPKQALLGAYRIRH
jgi:hypothetical protein